MNAGITSGSMPIVPLALLKSDAGASVSFTVDWTRYKIIHIFLNPGSAGLLNINCGANSVAALIANTGGDVAHATFCYDARTSQILGTMTMHGGKVAGQPQPIDNTITVSVAAGSVQVCAWGVAIR